MVEVSIVITVAILCIHAQLHHFSCNTQARSYNKSIHMGQPLMCASYNQHLGFKNQVHPFIWLM